MESEVSPSSVVPSTRPVEDIIRELLGAVGEDPDREGLRDTPRRVAAWWREFLEYDPGRTDTAFEHMGTDQMVVISGMRVWSLCEHHLLPFWCDIDIAYIATNQIIGLSKVGRLAHKVAHRLQVQERLCHQLADELEARVGPNVAVVGRGQHLCMTMRGIRTPATMTTSVLRGAFLANPSAKAEFMAYIRPHP